MNFIAKIFNEKIDDTVHYQFVRYSIGEYTPKAVAKIKNGATAKIVTGFEFVHDIIELAAESVKSDLTVSGKIYLKKQMDVSFELIKKKGFMVGEIQQKITPKELKEWVNKYGTEGYLLLNIVSDGLTIKTSQTPHNPKGKYNVKFCTVTVSGPLKDTFLKDMLFDINTQYKIADIKHIFLINDIIIPKEYENDMALARIHGKRKGTIIREVILDGKAIQAKKEFLA